MSVVLLSHGEIGSGALTAHLLGLARRLSPHETVHHLALVGPRLWASAAGRERLAGHRREAAGLLSGRSAVRPHGPRGLARPLVARLTAQALRGLVGSGPAVLHARGYQAALAACDARDLEGALWRVLQDVRGDRSAEVAAHGGEAPAERVAEWEREACRRSDASVAVSHALADLVQARGARPPVEVFACAADTRRFRPRPEEGAARRAAAGIPGEAFVTGFLGSDAGWQRPDALLALHRRILARRPDAHLLVLTPAVERFEALLSAGLPPGAGRTVRRVAHDEVPSWLAACDATVLLRDLDAVNAVASPIKFGESLACGVPVLLSEGIGDASPLVRDRGLGAVFSGPELAGEGDDSELERFLGEQAADAAGLAGRCRRAAEELWSWEEQVPRWLALHERLAGGLPMGDSSKRRSP